MSFIEASEKYGTPFWDFHRTDLHRCLYNRMIELGGHIRVNSRVNDVVVNEEAACATIELTDGSQHSADLVVGADGIHSRLREVLVGHRISPTPTGDIAYRLLLRAEDVLHDPELAPFVTDPQVTYWMGPQKHAVVYLIRKAQFLNMVLLVPDDMPDNATKLDASVEEMVALFEGWDPKILKLLNLCQSVQKWKLCIQQELAHWTHPKGHFILLGDSVHATLPYLASG
jgi:salicylate hydroxylase